MHNSLGSLNIFHFIANFWIQQAKTAKSYLLATAIGPNTNISACYLVIMPNKCIINILYRTERLAMAARLMMWLHARSCVLPSFEWTSSNYHCSLPDSAYRQQQALLDHQTWLQLKDTRSDNFLHSRTKNAVILVLPGPKITPDQKFRDSLRGVHKSWEFLYEYYLLHATTPLQGLYLGGGGGAGAFRPPPPHPLTFLYTIELPPLYFPYPKFHPPPPLAKSLYIALPTTDAVERAYQCK